jgi:two-component sensor histidine kinase
LSGLGDDTIVFYFPVFSDSEGAEFIPRKALATLAAESEAPIYTFWSTMLGSGTVGGVMIDPEQTAQALIDQILSYREAGVFPEDYQTHKAFLDWQALARHGIDTRGIPNGVEIVNRPERLIATYFTEIVLSAAGVMAIVVAIVTILLSRDRRLNRELQATGQALERAAEVKQTLYEEMNHRTKNNLMILGSLVNLQLAQAEEDAVRTPLEDVSSRLHTLALVHDSLYSSERTGGADVGPYLQLLVGQIKSGMVADDGPSFHLHVEEMLLDSKKAVACGLLVNELLTNAIKYAFPAGEAGDITITLRRWTEDEVELSFTDSGQGLPAHFDIEASSGLGMKIVQSLSQELNGDLTVTSEAGASFVLRFPG